MRGRRGFTLIEIMLVATLMMVFVSMATPRFQGAYSDYELKNTAFNIKKFSDFARERATLQRSITEIRFNFQKNTYQLWEVLSEDQSRSLSGRAGQINRIPENITLRGSSTKVRFYSNGASDQAQIDLFNDYERHYRVHIYGYGSEIERPTD